MTMLFVFSVFRQEIEAQDRETPATSLAASEGFKPGA